MNSKLKNGKRKLLINELVNYHQIFKPSNKKKFFFKNWEGGQDGEI